MMKWNRLLILSLFLLFQEHASGMDDKEIGKGGPPKKPPTLGEKVTLYDSNEKVKIDEDGRAYIGVSLKELHNLGGDS